MKLVITESQARALFLTEGIIPDNWKQKASEWASKKASKWAKDVASSKKGKEIINKVAQSDIGKDIAQSAMSGYGDQMKKQIELSPELKAKFSDIDIEKSAPNFTKFMNALGAEMYNDPTETQAQIGGEALDNLRGKEIRGKGMLHPLRHKVKIDSRFGKRKAPTAGATTNHQGIDLGTPSGTPVYAPLDGTVIKSLDTSPNGCGGHIRINHGDNLETKYCHLKQMVVKPGEKVKKGQHIGYTGGDINDPGRGISTGPHLHYEVVVDGNSVDPLLVQPDLA